MDGAARDVVRGTWRSSTDHPRRLVHCLEGVGALEIRASQQQDLVHRSFDREHRRHSGDPLHLCVQQDGEEAGGGGRTAGTAAIDLMVFGKMAGAVARPFFNHYFRFF